MIKVLNHGHVRLVNHMGSDLDVVRNARVSYDAEWRTGEDDGKDAKLIDYLVKNHHTSPLECVTFTFDIKAPIFVFRQWHRHRTWCLAGDTKVEFIRPADGKPYHLTIVDLAEKWNTEKVAVRQRGDRSIQEFNRDRIGEMRLRVRSADGKFETSKITDVWQSGVKQTLVINAAGKQIRASADHQFLTPDGWVKAGELSGKYVCMKTRTGGHRYLTVPTLNLADEKWAVCADGYEVSDQGRVRSYLGQGARRKKSIASLKKVTVNHCGRAMVNIDSKLIQVSVLVAKAFVAGEADGLFVLHKNDNPSDNRASNLYWGTSKQNAEDSARNGTRAVRSMMFFPVTSIEEGPTEPVYDLTVDHPEHNFLANGFVVHNCYNEVSARYSELPEEYYIPEVSQITTQSSSNKQMRTDDIHPDAEMYQRLIAAQCEEAFTVYQEMLRSGVPRELARGVLPMNTYSHMFGTVSLHNLANFLRLRLHNHAQHEIRVYAQAMLDLIEPLVPVTVAALRRHVLGVQA